MSPRRARRSGVLGGEPPTARRGGGNCSASPVTFSGPGAPTRCRRPPATCWPGAVSNPLMDGAKGETTNRMVCWPRRREPAGRRGTATMRMKAGTALSGERRRAGLDPDPHEPTRVHPSAEVVHTRVTAKPPDATVGSLSVARRPVTVRGRRPPRCRRPGRLVGALAFHGASPRRAPSTRARWPRPRVRPPHAANPYISTVARAIVPKVGVYDTPARRNPRDPRQPPAVGCAPGVPRQAADGRLAELYLPVRPNGSTGWIKR